MTEITIYNVIPKNNIFADSEYVQGSREELEEKYTILKVIEITPALDDEGVKKFIAELKANDHEKMLKDLFETAYGIPYEEKCRDEAERLWENGKESRERIRKGMERLYTKDVNE